MGHVKYITRGGVQSVWSCVKPLLPVLAPFLVTVVFILLYCGPNRGRE